MCRLVNRLVCPGGRNMLGHKNNRQWRTTTPATSSHYNNDCGSGGGFVSLTSNIPKIHRSWYHHSSYLPLEVPVGGDFVGLSASFHPQSGAFIPVPEYMIPKSLLQWGQAPTSLQVFTCEHVNPPVDHVPRHLFRQTWTMYPETDCGVENIQTEQREQHLEVHHAANSDEASAAARVWSYRTTAELKSTIVVESSFVGFSNDQQHRVRMVVRVEIDENHNDNNSPIGSRYSIVAPVTIILERQLNSLPIFGSRNTKGGGGVDAAQMIKWMGPILLKYDSFAVNPVTLKWRRSMPCDGGSPFVTEVMFPGNLTLSYGSLLGTSSWVLEMGHIVPQEQIRRVARLCFHSPSDVQVKTWVESGVLTP